MQPLDAPTSSQAPAGFRLGDPIALEDLLALPPDGRRYGRDEEGRLILMSPDDARRHRIPLTVMTALLNRAIVPSWSVAQEPSLAFPRVWSREGRLLGPSRLGRKAVEPDLAVYDRFPPTVAGNPEAEREGWTLYDPQGLRLVIELVSPRTWADDLGRPSADRVDRWRTYLDNGVAEYWILNAGFEGLPLPPRSGLFLAHAGDRWAPLAGEDLEHAPAEVEGFRPVRAGRVPSRAVPGLTLDVASYWSDACR